LRKCNRSEQNGAKNKRDIIKVHKNETTNKMFAIILNDNLIKNQSMKID
jgi:hypothetical protein